jgi:DNA-binding CsgD family transcriptional regulator
MDTSDRVERLLALLLVNDMKGSSQSVKAQQLSVAGFTNTEIADLLQTSAAVIATYLYQARRKPGKKRKKP